MRRSVTSLSAQEVVHILQQLHLRIDHGYRHPDTGRRARGPRGRVERKGIGHPDTICDGVSEQISVELCRHYFAPFRPPSFTTTSTRFCCAPARRVRPSAGGEILTPIDIVLAGRATDRFEDRPISVHEIAVEACRSWLRRHLPHLDVDRHVRIHPWTRPGSTDLGRSFVRGARSPLANDTSCCVGFAPLSQLERVVLEVELRLNEAATKERYPAIGSDIKIHRPTPPRQHGACLRVFLSRMRAHGLREDAPIASFPAA